MSGVTIERHGNWEYTKFGGKRWKRRVGTTQWVQLDSPPPAGSPPMELKLVRQRQTPGEPDHWAIFLSHEGQPGAIFQVKGDSTAMHFVHTDNVNVLSSNSYKDSYIIAQPTEQQAAKIRYWATHETPPSAPNQAAVQENCQGWVIRVINRLVTEGIVQQKWQNFAISIKQSIK